MERTNPHEEDSIKTHGFDIVQNVLKWAYSGLFVIFLELLIITCHLPQRWMQYSPKMGQIGKQYGVDDVASYSICVIVHRFWPGCSTTRIKAWLVIWVFIITPKQSWSLIWVSLYIPYFKIVEHENMMWYDFLVDGDSLVFWKVRQSFCHLHKEAWKEVDEHFYIIQYKEGRHN